MRNRIWGLAPDHDGVRSPVVQGRFNRQYEPRPIRAWWPIDVHLERLDSRYIEQILSEDRRLLLGIRVGAEAALPGEHDSSDIVALPADAAQLASVSSVRLRQRSPLPNDVRERKQGTLPGENAVDVFGKPRADSLVGGK